jgi:hypothetical protein
MEIGSDERRRVVEKYQRYDSDLSWGVCRDLEVLSSKGVRICGMDEEDFNLWKRGDGKVRLCLGATTIALCSFVGRNGFVTYEQYRELHKKELYPGGDDNDEYRIPYEWARALFGRVREDKTPVVMVVHAGIDEEVDDESDIDRWWTAAEFEWLVDEYQSGMFPLIVVLGLPGHE